MYKMIPIRNIYYMLAYAFDILFEKQFEKLATEHFEDNADFYAKILSIGLSNQIKKGINNEYVEVTNALSSPKGCINISESILPKHTIKHNLVCTFDEYSSNCLLNRIIVTTIYNLLKFELVSKQCKQLLKKQLLHLPNIDFIDLRTIKWNQIDFDRSNKTYRTLIWICEFIYRNLLQTQLEGKKLLAHFGEDEKHMHRLYEKFILKYLIAKFPDLSPRSEYIDWQCKDANSFLPSMKTDVTLEYGSTILILDAKYYNHILCKHFNQDKLNSANFYQMYSYVRNKLVSKQFNSKVNGILLYAATDTEDIDFEYEIESSKICFKTLNLNMEFSQIEEQISKIIHRYFPALPK